jgi:hypothetical protein
MDRLACGVSVSVSVAELLTGVGSVVLARNCRGVDERPGGRGGDVADRGVGDRGTDRQVEGRIVNIAGGRSGGVAGGAAGGDAGVAHAGAGCREGVGHTYGGRGVWTGVRGDDGVGGAISRHGRGNAIGLGDRKIFRQVHSIGNDHQAIAELYSFIKQWIGKRRVHAGCPARAAAAGPLIVARAASRTRRTAAAAAARGQAAAAAAAARNAGKAKATAILPRSTITSEGSDKVGSLSRRAEEASTPDTGVTTGAGRAAGTSTRNPH